jgi:Uncharacterized protein conserved in bacteria (DUF2130)
VDGRGIRAGAILWECKNTRHWSDTWIPKLKADQRAIRADVAVLVTACLPKGVSRLAYVDGVLVTDFSCAAGVAAIVRTQILSLAQARHASIHKEARTSATASRPWSRRSMACATISIRNAAPPNASGPAAPVSSTLWHSISPACTEICRAWSPRWHQSADWSSLNQTRRSPSRT